MLNALIQFPDGERRRVALLDEPQPGREVVAEDLDDGWVAKFVTVIDIELSDYIVSVEQHEPTSVY